MPNVFSARSGAFESGESIPDKYTCEGANVSPPFTLQNIPEGTETVVLITDDPDAPNKTFVHWVLFNVPASSTTLAEDLDVGSDFESGDVLPLEGVNDFGDRGYGGPCPPPGSPHHYHFRFYALDQKLDLNEGATKKQVTQAMDGHVLAETNVIGTYER